MSKTRFKCHACPQEMMVDSSATGKNVRCPKCGQTTVVPKLERPTETSAGEPQRPTPTPTSASMSPTDHTVVTCKTCGKKLSVKLIDQPSMATCPNCSARLKLPARKATPAAAELEPVVTAEASAAVAESSPPPRKTVPSQAPTSNNPFGDLGLPDASPGAFDAVPHAHANTGAPRTRTAHTKKSSTAAQSSPGFLNWVRSHPLMVAIIGMNIIATLIGVFHWPLLQVCFFQVPIGALMVGLLFAPRLHLMDRLFDRYKARAAGLGAGGVALVGAAIIIRVVLRSMRREGGWDTSVILGMIVFFFAFWAVVIGFAYLWKRFGVFRVLSWAYLVQLSFLTLSLSVTGLADAKRDADFKKRTAEFEAESKQFAEDAAKRAAQGLPPDPLAGFEPPPNFGSRGRSSRQTPGSGRAMMSRKEAMGADEGEVLIVFRHPDDVDQINFKNALIEKLGSPDHQSQAFGSGKTSLLITTELPLEDVAKHIGFGKVTTTDEDRRIIRVLQES